MSTQYHLGLFAGLSITKEYSSQLITIFKWLSRKAKTGNADAQANLGVMHAMGLGTAVDSTQAFQCFQQAADQENLLGMYNTGIAHARGEGTPYNPDKALTCFKQAADEKFIPAILTLAQWYGDPTRWECDFERAFITYKRAAKLDDPEGLYRLALYYFDGKVTSKNSRKAIQLLTQAAEMNNIGAQITLRNYYCHKSPDRRTKNWRPPAIDDREMAIIWNFVLCNTHNAAPDPLGHYLLPYAERLGLVYPRCPYDCGAAKLSNEIVEAINEHLDDEQQAFHETRQWAKSSGITNLYPPAMKKNKEATASS
jgi:TPR repeat protein